MIGAIYLAIVVLSGGAALAAVPLFGLVAIGFFLWSVFVEETADEDTDLSPPHVGEEESTPPARGQPSAGPARPSGPGADLKPVGASWRPDPEGVWVLRYWDGRTWTTSVQTESGQLFTTVKAPTHLDHAGNPRDPAHPERAVQPGHPRSGTASQRSNPPIPNYDAFRVVDLLPLLDCLPKPDLAAVAAYEAAHKNRSTVAAHIEKLISARNSGPQAARRPSATGPRAPRPSNRVRLADRPTGHWYRSHLSVTLGEALDDAALIQMENVEAARRRGEGPIAELTRSQRMRAMAAAIHQPNTPDAQTRKRIAGKIRTFLAEARPTDGSNEQICQHLLERDLAVYADPGFTGWKD